MGLHYITLCRVWGQGGVTPRLVSALDVKFSHLHLSQQLQRKISVGNISFFSSLGLGDNNAKKYGALQFVVSPGIKCEV